MLKSIENVNNVMAPTKENEDNDKKQLISVNTKKRISQLSFNDKEDLCYLVSKYPILHLKPTQKGGSLSKLVAEKKKAWNNLTMDFNNNLPVGHQKRTSDQLQKSYSNLVQRGKVVMADERRRVMQTGGGPQEKIKEVDELPPSLHNLIKPIVQPLQNVDSDGNIDMLEAGNTKTEKDLNIGNEHEFEDRFDDIVESPMKKRKTAGTTKSLAIEAAMTRQALIDKQRQLSADLLLQKAEVELKTAQLKHEEQLRQQDLNSLIVATEKIRHLFWVKQLEKEQVPIINENDIGTA